MQKIEPKKRKNRKKSPIKGRKRPTKRKDARSILLPLTLGISAFLLLLSVGLYSLTAYQDKRIKRDYPLKYTELILNLSAEYELDPYLIAAVIHTESTFRHDVVSRAGAVGLMQIMPDTGQWLWGKLDNKDNEYDVEYLKSPAVNLEMGCWYLRFLFNRYEGRVREPLTAYNAGQGQVDQWLADARYSQDGKTLTVIPGKDASAYAGKVLKTYAIYKKEYKKDLGTVPDSIALPADALQLP